MIQGKVAIVTGSASGIGLAVARKLAGGVFGPTKTVAFEVAETSITCNAVCPAHVKTPLVEGQIRDQAEVRDMSEDRQSAS